MNVEHQLVFGVEVSDAICVTGVPNVRSPTIKASKNNIYYFVAVFQG